MVLLQEEIIDVMQGEVNYWRKKKLQHSTTDRDVAMMEEFAKSLERHIIKLKIYQQWVDQKCKEMVEILRGV